MAPTLHVNGVAVNVDPTTMLAGPKYIHKESEFFGALEVPLPKIELRSGPPHQAIKVVLRFKAGSVGRVSSIAIVQKAEAYATTVAPTVGGVWVE